MRICQGVNGNIKEDFVFEKDEVLKERNMIIFYCFSFEKIQLEFIFLNYIYFDLFILIGDGLCDMM